MGESCKRFLMLHVLDTKRFLPSVEMTGSSELPWIDVWFSEIVFVELFPIKISGIRALPDEGR
jgi:hypothetical protein